MRLHKFQVSSIKYQVFVILFLVTCYLLPVTNTIHAQSINLSISPPLVKVMIKPGKSVLIAYTVSNGESPIVLSSQVGTFTPRGKNGNIYLSPEILGPIRFGLENSDIKLSESTYLKSMERKQFLLKVRVPNNTTPGDYYYTFYVKTDSGAIFTGNNISKSTATIGSNILISVTENGQLDHRGKIAEFKLIDNDGVSIFGKKYYFVESLSKIPISLIIENTGKNIIEPNGDIEVRGPLGILSSHKLTPVNILAESQRVVPATPSAQLGPSLVLNGFFIGSHKVEAHLDFGAGTKSINSTIQFVAIPLRLFMGLFITIILSTVIIRRLKRPTLIE